MTTRTAPPGRGGHDARTNGAAGNGARPDPSQGGDPSGVPLLVYAEMVWRRRLLVLAVALSMAVPAFVFTSLQAPTYQSSAGLLIIQRTLDTNFNIEDPGLTDLQINTQVALLTSQQVAQRAAELGATGTVRGTGTSNSNVVTVIAASADPVAAADTVRAYLQAYQAYRTERTLAALDGPTDQIQSRIDSLRTQLENAAGPQQVLILQQEQSRLQDQLGRLDIQRSLASSTATVVREPNVPLEPMSPRPLRDSLLALVLGLVLGMSVAILLETLRRRSVSGGDFPGADQRREELRPSEGEYRYSASAVPRPGPGPAPPGATQPVNGVRPGSRPEVPPFPGDGSRRWP